MQHSVSGFARFRSRLLRRVEVPRRPEQRDSRQAERRHERRAVFSRVQRDRRRRIAGGSQQQGESMSCVNLVQSFSSLLSQIFDIVEL